MTTTPPVPGPAPSLPIEIPIDPQNPPEILSSKAKAIIGAILSILGLICGFIAAYMPDPWFGILFGLAGLFNVIGVPLGIYQTQNQVKRITLPPSHTYSSLAAPHTQEPGAVIQVQDSSRGRHSSDD